MKMKLACSMVGTVAGTDEKVPVGSCVATYTADKLADEYDTIIHTTPPFFNHFNKCPMEHLRKCYQNSIKEAFSFYNGSGFGRVAVPLLGAGGRGFPIKVAIDIAASEAHNWCQDDNLNDQSGECDSRVHQTLAFGILEVSHADQLVEAIQLRHCAASQNIL